MLQTHEKLVWVASLLFHGLHLVDGNIGLPPLIKQSEVVKATKQV
jgi:hypothetical protein